MYWKVLIPLAAVGGALAQNTDEDSSKTSSGSSTTTGSVGPGTTVVSLYGLERSSNTYGASVVSADKVSTTLKVTCTPPSGGAGGEGGCNTATPLLWTYSGSAMHIATSTQVGGVPYSADLGCSPPPAATPSAIVCTMSVSLPGGQSGAALNTVSGDAVPTIRLTVTAGKEKLDAASTVEPSQPSQTAGGSSSSNGGNANSKGAASRNGDALTVAMAGAAGVVGALAFLL